MTEIEIFLSIKKQKDNCFHLQASFECVCGKHATVSDSELIRQEDKWITYYTCDKCKKRQLIAFDKESTIGAFAPYSSLFPFMMDIMRCREKDCNGFVDQNNPTSIQTGCEIVESVYPCNECRQLYFINDDLSLSYVTTREGEKVKECE